MCIDIEIENRALCAAKAAAFSQLCVTEEKLLLSLVRS